MLYLATLSQLLADAQQPGFYPFIYGEALWHLRHKWYVPPFLDAATFTEEECVIAAPLTKLIAKRLGPDFVVSDDTPCVIYFRDYPGIGFHCFFVDTFWKHVARTERKCLFKSLPWVLSQFRRFPLYEKHLWRVIFAYADVPVRFR